MVLHQHGSRLSTLSFQRTFQFVWCVRMFKVPSHQLPPPITSTSNGQPTQPTPRDRIIAMTIRAMIDPAARCGFNPRLYLALPRGGRGNATRRHLCCKGSSTALSCSWTLRLLSNSAFSDSQSLERRDGDGAVRSRDGAETGRDGAPKTRQKELVIEMIKETDTKK